MSDRRSFSCAHRDVRIVFADGAFDQLAQSINATLGPARIFLISTPGRSDLTARAQRHLGTQAVGVFHGARVHVPAAVVEEALQLVRALDPDCLVTIGGGSAIGLGKALARKTGLPLVAVPTTYSGSEMTDIWGMTDGQSKTTGRDSRVAPRLVVYDPRLTHSMPPDVTGPSGMNALAHAVEALYSTAANPVASLLGSEGIRLLSVSLPVLVRSPTDAAARWDALCGAHLCGYTLDLTSMGLHHKLCHVLGGVLDLPHALTHAVMLPYSVAYNREAAREALAVVAAVMEGTDAARALYELNERLGITGTLGQLGVTVDDVDRVVELVVAGSYPNPAPVTREGIRRLLEDAIAGTPHW